MRYRHLLGVKWSQVQILSARPHRNFGLPALMLFLADLRWALLEGRFGTTDGSNAALGLHNGPPIGLKTTLRNSRAFAAWGQTNLP
jgi:hypothetical protein